jgi:hypothetical protein
MGSQSSLVRDRSIQTGPKEWDDDVWFNISQMKL